MLGMKHTQAEQHTLAGEATEAHCDTRRCRESEAKVCKHVCRGTNAPNVMNSHTITRVGEYLSPEKREKPKLSEMWPISQAQTAQAA